MGDTIERARGRWGEILPRLGIAPKFLVNKHGPCPLCGGRDRFRYDDRDGTGSYFCGQCGAGVGIILVRKLRGWNHATACREVDAIIGNGSAWAPHSRAKPLTDRGAAIRKLLGAANQPAVVNTYLGRRGLGVTSPILRGHPACPYYDHAGNLVGHYPAIVAPILDAGGALQSALRIYDAALEPRKKVMPAVETITAAAIRLFDHGPELGITEGVETALAAYQLFGTPTWSCVTTHGIETFSPPAGLQRLVVFADNDGNYAGQAAAYRLAHRLYGKISVTVRVPPAADSDWLDALTSGVKA